MCPDIMGIGGFVGIYRIFQDLSVFVGMCRNVLNVYHSRVYRNVSDVSRRVGNWRICRDLSGFIRIRWDLLGCVGMCRDVSGFNEIWRDLPGFCQDLLEWEGGRHPTMKIVPSQVSEKHLRRNFFTWEGI